MLFVLIKDFHLYFYLIDKEILVRRRCQLLDFDGCISFYCLLETHQVTEELLLGLFWLRLLPVSDENYGARIQTMETLRGIANSLTAEATLKLKFFHLLETKARDLFILVLVDFVGVKTPVKFDLLLRGELERLLTCGNIVP